MSADAGGEKSVIYPLRRLANSVGGNVARLSTRGTLIDGELRSAQAPTTAPPVWFVFTGVLSFGVVAPVSPSSVILLHVTGQLGIMGLRTKMSCESGPQRSCVEPVIRSRFVVLSLHRRAWRSPCLKACH